MKKTKIIKNEHMRETAGDYINLNENVSVPSRHIKAPLQKPKH